jgi:hypothetical protein
MRNQLHVLISAVGIYLNDQPSVSKSASILGGGGGAMPALAAVGVGQAVIGAGVTLGRRAGSAASARPAG